MIWRGCSKTGEYMISTIDSNKGMLSVRGIKGVEIVDIPVEPELELPVSCRVILWGS